MARVNLDSVSNEEAMEFRCPKCEASKGNPCTYLTHSPNATAYVTVGFTTAGFPIKEQQIKPSEDDRFGKPTKRVHQERGDVALKARQRPTPTPVDPVTAEHRAAFQALAAWSQCEYAELRDWLRDYHWLLTGTVPSRKVAARYLTEVDS